MRIAIISSCSLPVPAVNGGAVESLIETIVKENELQDQLDIDVYTIFNQQAKQISEKYPHTTFRYLVKNSLVKSLDKFITLLLRIVKQNKSLASRNYVWKLIVISKLKKQLKEYMYDKIVLENTIYLFDIFKDKQLYDKYSGKIFFHIHNSLVKKTTVEYGKLLKRNISISDYLHPNIKHFFDKNVDIVTVHNGVDSSMFGGYLTKSERIEIRNKYHIPVENKIIIFVGRITPEKGIRETIDAFCRLKRNDCNLLIVGASYFGSGTISPFESEMIKKIKDNPRIHMTGYVDQNEIWKLYALGNIALLPSMWDEPLGLTMIEAQATGVPLITTKSGGILETVDEKYSILLDRDDDIVENICVAMEKILNHQAEWNVKAQHAQKRVKEYFDNAFFYREFIKALDVPKGQ